MALTKVTGHVIKSDTNIISHNINSSGIITAVNFDGNVSGVAVTFTGDSTICSLGITTNLTVGGNIDVDGHTDLDNVSVAGVTTFSDDVIFNGANFDITYDRSINTFNFDQSFLKFGTSGQLVFRSTGPFSTIDSTAGLIMTVSSLEVKQTSGDKMIKTYNNGAVELYHDDNLRLTTSTKGIQVGTGVTIETNGQATFVGIITAADGINCTTDGVGNGINIGASQDLIIQHNGTNSFIDNNTGDLYIQTTGSGDDILIESADDFTVKTATKTAIEAIGDGAVKIYHNGSTDPKIYTNSIGVTVDNVLYISGPAGNPGRLRFQEGGALSEIRGVRNTDDSSFLYFDTEIGGTTATRLIIDGSGNLRPATDSDYNLGTNTIRWANVYADTYYGDGSNLTGIVSDKIFEGNTEVECIDTGTNGTIKFTTEGNERLRIDNGGRLSLGVQASPGAYPVG